MRAGLSQTESNAGTSQMRPGTKGQRIGQQCNNETREVHFSLLPDFSLRVISPSDSTFQATPHLDIDCCPTEESLQWVALEDSEILRGATHPPAFFATESSYWVVVGAPPSRRILSK